MSATASRAAHCSHWRQVAKTTPRSRIHQRDATLWVGRLPVGSPVRLPEAPYVHLFVARGAADVEGVGTLTAGDAVRFTNAGGRTLTPNPPDGVEVTVWETYSEVQ